MIGFKKFCTIAFIANFTLIVLGLGAVTVQTGGMWIVLPVCVCFYVWIECAWKLVEWAS